MCLFVANFFLCLLWLSLVRDDGAAEADGPTTVSIGEEHALKRVFRATALRGPMLAAVNGVNDRSFGADGPAFLRINKLHVE